MEIEKLFKDLPVNGGKRYDGDAIVILSGGQDSVTSLFWAFEKFDRVYGLNFSYGQRHSQETKIAKDICNKLAVPFKSINLEGVMGEITSSALLESTSDINKKNKKGLPVSFVPNRNQIFITFAHSLAQKYGCDYLVTGVCQTDYSGYPDCRRDFIDILERATNMGSDDNIKIITPLMYLDKADTFRLAEELGCLPTVLQETMTCYNGDETKHDWGMGCDNCPACNLRKNGYGEFIKRYH